MTTLPHFGCQDSFSPKVSLKFNRKGFLTGVLQNHARKTAIPIDNLSFKFKVIDSDPTRI